MIVMGGALSIIFLIASLQGNILTHMWEEPERMEPSTCIKLFITSSQGNILVQTGMYSYNNYVA